MGDFRSKNKIDNDFEKKEKLNEFPSLRRMELKK